LKQNDHFFVKIRKCKNPAIPCNLNPTLGTTSEPGEYLIKGYGKQTYRLDRRTISLW